MLPASGPLAGRPPMLIEELYDALIEAGASDEKARAASRAVADMESHFGSIEKQMMYVHSDTQRELTDLRTEMKHEFAAVRAEIDQKIGDVGAEMRAEFTDIRGTLRLHNW